MPSDPVLPPALRPGSRVALLSPAGPVHADRLDRALERCQQLELEPVPGQHVMARHGYLAGTDADRLADFARAVADPSIDAIWAMRGGYGTMRLLDRLDLSPLLRSPKAFIGFSDNTAVHLALDRLGVVSFHGPHAGAEYGDFSVEGLRTVLFRAEPAGCLPATDPPRTLFTGAAEGRLVGGNLALLAAACGTPFELVARNRIVFIEDVNEPAYRIDRAFTQLRLAGCLEGVRAVAFGAFSWDDETPEDEPPVEELLRSLVEPLGVPAVSGLPFGHIDDQWCIPVGTRARLDAVEGTLTLLEPAVAAAP
jgi:muramoyltetrapeptide carboxypeptidase